MGPVLIKLIDMGGSRPLWAAPSPRGWVLNCGRVERASALSSRHLAVAVVPSTLDYDASGCFEFLLP